MTVHHYEESVRAVQWFLLLLGVAVLGCLVGAAGALLSEAEGRGPTVVMLLGVAVLLVAVGLCFARLRIEVSDRTVRFRFGPFGPTLDVRAIRSADAVPYRWVAFGGWGVRLGRISGQWVRAYSVPFVRTGVALEVSSGRRYYVSSRHAEALASAIRGVAAREGQA